MKFHFTIFLLSSAVAKAADTNSLPALAPAYGELPPTFWEEHQSAIIVVSFAILAFAFFFLKVMLRPESSVILPPEVLARQALTKLQGQPEDGKILSEISQTLCRYIVAAFDLAAAEMTTAEFCAELAGNEKVSAELAQKISSFLRENDGRKFSTSPATAPLNAATRALELVALAEKRRAELRAQISTTK